MPPPPKKKKFWILDVPKLILEDWRTTDYNVKVGWNRAQTDVSSYCIVHNAVYLSKWAEITPATKL